MTEEQKAKFSKRLNKAVVKKIVIAAGVTVAVVGVTFLLSRKLDDATMAGYEVGLKDGAEALVEN